MAHRILFAMFDSGVFDNPVPPQTHPPTEVTTPQHQQVATDVAEAGTVLLKNEDDTLPLSGQTHSIALIGPTGDDAVFVTGGSAGVPLAPGQAITPAQGITSRRGAGRGQRDDRAGVGRRRRRDDRPVLGADAVLRNGPRAARAVLEQHRPEAAPRSPR